jgi:hypothetical protein
MLWQFEALLGLAAFMLAGLASMFGASRHHSDLAHGADFAEAAQERRGVLQVLRRFSENRQVHKSGSLVNGGWLRLGCDQRGMPFSIPVGYESGVATRSCSARSAPGRPSARRGSPAG